MSDPRDINRFETAPIAKQVGGPPPPPPYYPSAGAPPVNQAPQQYQYPNSHQPPQQQQPPQFQQQQPQYVSQQQFQQQPQQQQHYVGTVPVVHGVAATPSALMVTASPLAVNTPASPAQNKLDGYPFSPNIGQTFSGTDCDQSCMMSCCCPCIVGGQVAQKINVSSFGMVCGGYIVACVILFIVVLFTYNAAGLAPWLVLWIGWSAFVLSLRSKVRQMWRIPGDGCDDCCFSFFCTACSLRQVATHVFGYRSSDSIPCGENGTPAWQAQAQQQVQQHVQPQQGVQYQQHHVQQQQQQQQQRLPHPQY